MGQFTYELDLPAGINSDDTTYAAKGRWADGNNVRFWEGKPQVIGGMTKLDYNLGTGLSAIFAYYHSTTIYIAYGASANLWHGSTFTAPSDITPTGGITGPWCLDAFGSTLLASKIGGTLYEYTQGVSTIATEVTQAPDQMLWMLVTPERQVLALGCNEELSGTFNASCIRWCDLEDYTDWTTTSANNAGEHILEGGPRIVTARMVGSYVGVWTSSGLFMGQFIGDPSQTYRFEKVADNCGAVSNRAVTVFNGVAYWVAPDLRIYTWAPGNPPIAIPCPIGRDFLDNVSVSLKGSIFMGSVSKFSEIWIFYGDVRDAHGGDNCTRYIAFSLIDGAWFRGQMERTAMLDSGVGQSIFSAASAMMMADPTGDLHIHEVAAGNEDIAWFIQSADQYLNSGRLRVQVQGVVQDFEGQSGAVGLTLFMRDRPLSTPVTKGPYSLAQGATKLNFRASGMLMAVKLSATSPTTYMRLGKPSFDCVTMGAR